MWTVRLPDGSVGVDATGALVTVDARGVPVVDARPAGEAPATVDLHVTWKGRGRRRRVHGVGPAFDARLFRTARAAGTFGASEDGFAFASSPVRLVRSSFAELGTEANGVFLPAAALCPRCAGRERAARAP